MDKAFLDSLKPAPVQVGGFDVPLRSPSLAEVKALLDLDPDEDRKNSEHLDWALTVMRLCIDFDEIDDDVLYRLFLRSGKWNGALFQACLEACGLTSDEESDPLPLE